MIAIALLLALAFFSVCVLCVAVASHGATPAEPDYYSCTPDPSKPWNQPHTPSYRS